jgi:hypothetical protein
MGLQRSLLDEGQNRLDNQGSGKMGGPGRDQSLARVVAGGQGGASDVGGIVATAIALGHASDDSLSGGKMGLNPPHRKRAKEQSPQITVIAIQ